MNKNRFLLAGSVIALLSPTFVQNVSNPVFFGKKNAVSSYSIINDKVSYIADKAFDKTINTFESWIKLPKLKDNEVGGIILGNYYNNSFGYAGSCDFMVDTKGQFRVFWNGANASNKCELNLIFNEADLRNEQWTHIALVRDVEQNKFLYYVNGELKGSRTGVGSDAVSTMKYQIGTDWENWTKNIDDLYERYPFKGEIRQVTLYEDAISSSRVVEDMNNENIKTGEFKTIGNWFLGNWDQARVEDSSKEEGVGFYLGNYEKYIDIEEVEEFDYTISAVPDIQCTNHHKPALLDYDFDTVVAKKDELNLQYICFLGDLTDTCDRDNRLTFPEWNRVTKNFVKFDEAGISYGFIPGNHDYDDGGGRTRSCEVFNRFLPYSKYSQKDYFGGAYFKGAMQNYFNIKNICGVDYLFMQLEFGPRDEVLTWANRVLDAYPNHRAVISTHSYLEPDGTITNPQDRYAPREGYGIGGGNSANNGIDMFEKVISQHSNVFMVWSGHCSSDDIIYRVDKGVHGNKIHTFLIDAQGSFFTAPCDVFSYFKINEARKTANVYWYSPENDKYLNSQNQFVIDFSDEFNPTIK